jgi:ubiquinone/menaquinone biosynthesis C-methylase UbiE
VSNETDASKRTTSGNFNRRAAGYDPRGTFAHYGRRLVEHTGIEAGMRVLDVATGRGAVLFPALEQVGGTGEAIGIDIAESMVQATAEEAQQRGVNVRVQVMDAEQLDFPDACFDRVLCGFGIMFFPNLSQAMSEFRRVLKPAERLGVSTWRVSQAEELRPVLQELLPDRRSDDRPSGWITEPEVLSRLLTDAGFGKVDVLADASSVHYIDVDQYLGNIRNTVRVIDELDESQLNRVRSALIERFRRYEQPEGIRLPAVALLASASRLG